MFKIYFFKMKKIKKNQVIYSTFSKHSCPFALWSTSTSRTTEFGCETRHHSLVVDILLSIIILSHNRYINFKSHCNERLAVDAQTQYT